MQKGVQVASKEDLEAARRREQIKDLERKGKLKAWNDWIGFAVSKATGLGGVILGGLEMLDPSVIAAPIPSPEIVLATGLALLTGKGILSVFQKAARVFGEDK